MEILKLVALFPGVNGVADFSGFSVLLIFTCADVSPVGVCLLCCFLLLMPTPSYAILCYPMLSYAVLMYL